MSALENHPKINTATNFIKTLLMQVLSCLVTLLVDDTFSLFDNKSTATQFLRTSITVTQISNSPLNSKRIVQSLSWTFSSNDTITLSQHLFTKRRPLLACTQNGTP